MEMISFQNGTLAEKSAGPARRAPVSQNAAAVLALFASTVQSPASQSISIFSLRTTTLPAEQRTMSCFDALAVPVVGPDLKAVRTIRELATLPDGWHGSGSVGPTPQAIADAETFARALYKSGVNIEPPHITAATDGEVNFYWDTKSGTVDLGFYGTGSYSFYASPEREAPSGGDEVAVNVVPNDILRIIGAAVNGHPGRELAA